jgi:hypothetical protein
MTLTTLMQADLDYAVTHDSGIFQSVLVWGEQTITGTRDVESREDEIEIEGFRDTSSIVWHGRLANFSNSIPPGVRAEVTIDGDDYYVESWEVSADDLHVELTCRRKRNAGD